MNRVMHRPAISLPRRTASLMRPARTTRRFITVNGVRVRYIDQGARHGGVPLLVVHGYNGSADYFYPHTIPGLAAERRVVALDLPGCGFSGNLPRHTLEAYVEFVIAFLDALGIEQADMLGHSMGGQLAIAIAASHPSRFRKLVLVSSSGLPELVKRLWLVPAKMLTDACMRHVRLYPTFIRTGLRGRVPFQGLHILMYSGIAGLLESLAVPTLIVWGSSDRIVPPEHGRWMAEHIPGARLSVLRGAGHMPFYQQPEKFNRLVLSFLRDETPPHGDANA